MGAAGATAVGLQTAGGAFSAYAQMQAGKAQSAYYGFLSNQSRLEGKLAAATGERQAEDTEKAAGFEEQILARRDAKLMGAQTAAFAANGIAGSVTAQDIAKSSMDSAELDKEALRLNADTKAAAQRQQGALSEFNYGMQGESYLMAGHNAIDAARLNSAATILGTGGSLATQWYTKGG